jgi:hypothetical protein
MHKEVYLILFLYGVGARAGSVLISRLRRLIEPFDGIEVRGDLIPAIDPLNYMNEGGTIFKVDPALT